jgi:hypothetical protein
MARREINVFSVSFLDLLSGALAAVIILFIVVPRIDIGEIQDLPELKELKGSSINLETLLSRIRGSISKTEYSAMEGETRKLQSAIVGVEDQMKELQGRLKRANKTIEEQEKTIKEQEDKIDGQSKQIKGYETTIDRLNDAKADLEKRLDDQPKKSDPIADNPKTPPVDTKDPEKTPTNPSTSPIDTTSEIITDKVTLGIQAPFVAVVQYDRKQPVRVNIYLRPEGKNTTVDFFNRNASFGKWRDVSRMYSGMRAECVVQDKIEPGEYIIYAHLASPRRGANAIISGFVGINPTEGRSKKFDFKNISIASGPPPGIKNGGTEIGRIVLTETSLSFTQTASSVQ